MGKKIYLKNKVKNLYNQLNILKDFKENSSERCGSIDIDHNHAVKKPLERKEAQTTKKISKKLTATKTIWNKICFNTKNNRLEY